MSDKQRAKQASELLEPERAKRARKQEEATYFTNLLSLMENVKNKPIVDIPIAASVERLPTKRNTR